MEYEILKQMIEELCKEASSKDEISDRQFYRYTDQIRILSQLRMRIDKAREADIINMSEGCI